LAGEAVALRIIEGKRGRMAVQVVSWETAARDKE
jgi:CspA family cold shock protein